MLENKLRIGTHIILSSLIFSLGTSWYFGWNMKPESSAEAWCNTISGIGTIIGIMWYTMPAIAALGESVRVLDNVHKDCKDEKK